MAWTPEGPRPGFGLLKGCGLALAFLSLAAGVALPDAAAAPALPALVEAPYRSVAGAPMAWLGRSGRLAYLGQAPGGGVLLAWDVLKRQVGRLGVGGVLALDASGDGRLAWVERLGLPLAESVASPTGMPARGPDKLWVQDMGTARRVEVLAGIEAQSGCLSFDRRDNRLALVLKDDLGQWRVAVQASGAPLEMLKLDPTVRVRRLVGWMASGETLVDADRPGRQAALVALSQNPPRVLPYVEGATLSPDGKSILGRSPGQPGVLVRGAGGGGRWLSPQADAYTWSAHPAVAFVGMAGDLLALGLDGKTRRRYPQALPGSGLGPLVMAADPSGRYVAVSAGDRLWVRRL